MRRRRPLSTGLSATVLLLANRTVFLIPTPHADRFACFVKGSIHQFASRIIASIFAIDNVRHITLGKCRCPVRVKCSKHSIVLTVLVVDFVASLPVDEVSCPYSAEVSLGRGPHLAHPLNQLGFAQRIANFAQCISNIVKPTPEHPTIIQPIRLYVMWASTNANFDIRLVNSEMAFDILLAVSDLRHCQQLVPLRSTWRNIDLS